MLAAHFAKIWSPERGNRPLPDPYLYLSCASSSVCRLLTLVVVLDENVQTRVSEGSSSHRNIPTVIIASTVLYIPHALSRSWFQPEHGIGAFRP
jgi:hypothetical protein